MKMIFPQTNIGKFLRKVKAISGPVSWWKKWQGWRIACCKAWALDELKKVLQCVRTRETVQGTADKIFALAVINIDKAAKIEEIEEAFGLSKQKLLHVPQEDIY
ncbi:MAG: hypothetical protein RBT41_05810 [Clostridia bacterium]|jgi:hypothetical protein|nr:hypothetical protein [Clostridia bacterium]